MERPANAQVKVESTASGGLMFDFSLGRNPGAALSATAFLLLWTGALWFCYTYAPIIFAVVVGLFELLLLGIILGLWLGESKVVIESGTVQVRGGLLGFGPKHVVSCSDVTDIALKIGMQTGGASGTPYYDIQLSYANGRKLTAGSGVRSKQEAEWLVAEMKRAMGLREKAEAARC